MIRVAQGIASERGRDSPECAYDHRSRATAFVQSRPLIGSGTGGFPEARAERLILDTLASLDFPGEIRVVRYR
ncbi:MAG TPA: hypothetical protein VM686_23945 [Polyangiaceae bacterium]|nr:hypothetical protein [Polyangiaceae bacterium]